MPAVGQQGTRIAVGEGFKPQPLPFQPRTEHHWTIPSTSIVSSAATPKTRLYEEAQLSTGFPCISQSFLA